MSLVIKFLGFHHVLIDCHIGAYPLFFKIVRSLFVCTYSPYREDESCYDIFGISSCFDKYQHQGISPIFPDHFEVVGLSRQFLSRI